MSRGAADMSVRATFLRRFYEVNEFTFAHGRNCNPAKRRVLAKGS